MDHKYTKNVLISDLKKLKDFYFRGLQNSIIFLARLRCVVFDYFNNKLYLTPNRNFGTPLKKIEW